MYLVRIIFQITDSRCRKAVDQNSTRTFVRQDTYIDIIKSNPCPERTGKMTFTLSGTGFVKS